MSIIHVLSLEEIKLDFVVICHLCISSSFMSYCVFMGKDINRTVNAVLSIRSSIAMTRTSIRQAQRIIYEDESQIPEKIV